MGDETQKKRSWRGRLLGRRNLNPTRVVVVGFLLVILLGTLLLMLPIASSARTWTSPLTALFTATSATCVTGLVLVDTWLHWSIFGQAVILAMIQLGGLGFMTLFALASFALHRRISLSERLVMSSAFNLKDIDGVVRLVRHAIRGTLLFEGIGAVALSVCFIPEFGLPGGIWRGVFHAVSAFCNAGFDLMGSQGAFCSLANYVNHPVVCVVIMCLIVVGGLGFFVWEDILRKRKWRKLSIYSKLVIICTVTLILFGFGYFLLAEWGNPGTLGGLPVHERPLAALFQSVTLRTAGFSAIDQGALYDTSKALSSLFMLIGGSAGSTAGGLKTVTVLTVILAVRSGLKGDDEITVHGRAISYRQASNAMTLTFFVIILLLCGSFLISLVDHLGYMDTVFEVSSAIGTVGLSTGLTPQLSTVSKVVLIACMYLGRVGVLSFAFALMAKKKSVGQQQVKHPAVDLMIG